MPWPIGRLQIHQQHREPLGALLHLFEGGGAGHEQHQVGVIHPRDPHLLSVHDVAVAVADGHRLHLRGVAAGRRLGHPEGLQPQLAAGDLGEIVAALRLGPVPEQRAHDVHLGMAGGRVAPRPVDLLQDDRRPRRCRAPTRPAPPGSGRPDSRPRSGSGRTPRGTPRGRRARASRCRETARRARAPRFGDRHAARRSPRRLYPPGWQPAAKARLRSASDASCLSCVVPRSCVAPRSHRYAPSLRRPVRAPCGLPAPSAVPVRRGVRESGGGNRSPNPCRGSRPRSDATSVGPKSWS